MNLSTLEAIETRRAVKKFDPEYKMSEEDIKSLMESSLLSPTSFNMQNWRFVVITDTEIRQKICEVAWNQAQVTEASILVVLCGNLNSYNEEPERYWRNAPQAASDVLVPMLKNFYTEREDLQRDEAMRSIGIASQTLMLAARSMGLDSCPMIGFDPAKVAEIINLPENHVIGMLLPIGKALEPARVRGGQLDYSEVVFRDKF